MSHEKPRHRAGFFVCGRVVGVQEQSRPMPRVPQTMERYGLVELRRQARQVRPVVEASGFLIQAA